MQKGMGGVFVLVFVALLASMSLFVVDETQRAVKLRFGEIIENDIQPGVHWKVPFMHSIRKFDARILTVESKQERFLTLEKKFLVVDSFAKWRISDVSKFYQATSGEEQRASALLSQRVNTGLRNQFGERTIQEVVSGERDELMHELTAQLNNIALEELGVEVVDIRVKRIDLPEQVSESVFARMNSEREREAREHRSRGHELAEGIKADADRQRTIIKAEAYRDAERVRGEGDATASAVYAKAYNKDSEFYSFTRSLKAYQESFGDKGDILLIEPDSDFFRYLKDSKGK